MSTRTFARSKNAFSLKHYALYAIALFVGLLFAACSSPLTEEETAQASGPSIDVIVTNYATPQGFNALLSPGTYAKDSIAKFTVDGEDKDGATFKGTVITIDENGVGTIKNVSKTLWNLTLHAYSDAAGTNEVLRGYAFADTSNGSTDVSFTLSSYGVTTKGSFSLTFSYSNEAVAFTSDVTDVTINICDHDSHAVKYTTVITNSTTPALSAWTDGTGYTYAKTDIPPAYYYLEVVFKNGSQQIGTYTDVLDIQPGRQTQKSVVIKNELFTKPADPENVAVYRVDDSLSADYYTAVIRWDDVATNEESYEINVYTYSSDTASTGTLVATLTYENYNTISLNAGDAVGYAGGDLWYGSEEYALRLKTGVLYDFTVTAVNSIGRSAAVSREASADVENDTTYKSALTGFGVSEDSPFLHVNTFTITYGLNNGTWKTSPANTNTGILLDYAIYKNQAINLRVPETIVDTSSGTEQEYPVLYLGNTENPWKYWAKDNINGEKIEQATTHKNLFVIAIYDVNDETFDIAFDNNGLSLTATGASETKIINIGGQVNSATYSTVTVTIDRTKNGLFTDFEVYINGTSQGRTTNTSDTATYTFSIPFKGTYTVQVAGIYNSTHYYSTEYVFSVN